MRLVSIATELNQNEILQAENIVELVRGLVQNVTDQLKELGVEVGPDVEIMATGKWDTGETTISFTFNK